MQLENTFISHEEQRKNFVRRERYSVVWIFSIKEIEDSFILHWQDCCRLVYYYVFFYEIEAKIWGEKLGSTSVGSTNFCGHRDQNCDRFWDQGSTFWVKIWDQLWKNIPTTTLRSSCCKQSWSRKAWNKQLSFGILSFQMNLFKGFYSCHCLAIAADVKGDQKSRTAFIARAYVLSFSSRHKNPTKIKWFRWH